MLLVDHEIRDLALKYGMIEPFFEGKEPGKISSGLTVAGYDLRLDYQLLLFKPTHNLMIDPKKFKDLNYQRAMFDLLEADSDGKFFLPPHSYALGTSVEYLRIPKLIKGTCVGKSTYARCGLLVNTTPLEPGWEGKLTLELGNMTPCPLILYANEGITQLSFEQLTQSPEADYTARGGKYNFQTGITPAKIQ